MTKLYRKSEIWFAVILIALYVVGASAADSVSGFIGPEKSATVVFHAALSVIVFTWIAKNNFLEKYGLCRPFVKAERFLWFVPLAAMSTVNLWFGICMNMSTAETVFYVISMVCVGFLEEIIFRGFLFRAMEKDGVRSAIIVSSLTFGIGHIVNLFNGSDMGLTENLCQIAYAVAFGFLFVTIFYRGGSLIPCIACHSVINALSVFANEEAIQGKTNIVLSIGLCIASLAYTWVLCKRLPKKNG